MRTKLEKWERKILRRIYDRQKIEILWRRMTNKKVLNMYGEPTIIDVIK